MGAAVPSGEESVARPCSTRRSASSSSSARCSALLLGEGGAGFGDGAADGEGGEIVAGLGQGAGGEAGGQGDDAVLDLAVLADEDREGRLRVEAHELDVLEHHVGLGRDHEAGAAREAREHLARAVEQILDRAVVGLGLHVAGDLGALAFVHRADLEHGVDEEAEALLGGRAARRRVRGRYEPEILEIGHDIAHGGGREAGFEEPRQVARADGDAGFEVALDELSENVLARALSTARKSSEAFVIRGPCRAECLRPPVHHLRRNAPRRKRPRACRGVPSGLRAG